jgi:hypothetical protein
VTSTARERFVDTHLATLASGLAVRLRSVNAPDLQLPSSGCVRGGSRCPAPQSEATSR